ncbi:MAG: hypothetical protein NC084_04820, partial [Bacteroides sp.]|nr:hypothetical protein [Bacteroides sp.]
EVFAYLFRLLFFWLAELTGFPTHPRRFGHKFYSDTLLGCSFCALYIKPIRTYADFCLKELRKNLHKAA